MYNFKNNTRAIFKNIITILNVYLKLTKWYYFLAEEVEGTTLVTVTPAEEEPKVPPRGQRHNPFNKVADGDSKAVPGSRHRKLSIYFVCCSFY